MFNTGKKMTGIRIVLVQTTHPGNIGAAARAMANMGLDRLYLVAPKYFPHAEATARAAGADHLLAQACVVSNLDEALAGCRLVFATSARMRTLPWPCLDARQAAHHALAAVESAEVAIVFGREHAGLTNEELARCQYHVHIPCNPHFSSLNLAQAVQILTYELHMASLSETLQCEERISEEISEFATAEELRGFYEHLQRVLLQIEFLRPNDKKLMLRMQYLFNRAQLREVEVQILRGILSAVEATAGGQDS